MWTARAETELNLRINNHRKDVLKLNAIPTDWHFAQRDHDFNTDREFVKLQNTKVSKESNSELLKKCKNFWTKKLETLRPKGPNHELDWQISSYAFFPFNLMSLLNAYRYQKSTK